MVFLEEGSIDKAMRLIFLVQRQRTINVTILRTNPKGEGPDGQVGRSHRWAGHTGGQVTQVGYTGRSHRWITGADR